jgi:hypothetical protein
MTEEDFDKLVDNRLNKIRELLIVKGREYRRNNNPFHNFEVGSFISNQTTTRVLDGFMLKHYISYRDILNDIDKGILPSDQLIEEKFTDIMVYLILQEANIKNMKNEL